MPPLRRDRMLVPPSPFQKPERSIAADASQSNMTNRIPLAESCVETLHVFA